MRNREDRHWKSWPALDAFLKPDDLRSVRRWSPGILVAGLLAMAVVAGCASTKVTSRDEIVKGKIARPATIWVYDFAATLSDVRPESALAGTASEHRTSQTPEQIATGRKLGAIAASELIEKIQLMGMNAKRGGAGTTPQINDIELRGYILSYTAGDEARRITIGFGSGSADVKAAMEGFQVTAKGLRKLGGGTVNAEDAKTPGVALGAATMVATHNPLGLVVSGAAKAYDVETGSSTAEGRARAAADEIAEQLKIRFKQEGWID